MSYDSVNIRGGVSFGEGILCLRNRRRKMTEEIKKQE